MLCDAAAILAGGTSSRVGQDKVLLRLANQSLLDRIFRELSGHFSEIFVIGSYRPSSIISRQFFFSDLVSDVGPLGGLYTALKRLSRPLLIVPCDMPFVSAGHIGFLLQQYEQDYQAVISVGAKGIEPLFAIYQPICLPLIESNLKQGQYALHKLIARLNVKTVDFTDDDKNYHIFFNINTLSDYKKALYLIKEHDK